MITDKSEFDEVYRQYKNLVMKAAYEYSGDYNLAEDITQSTFLQLYKYIDTMEKTNIKSWLYTTAKNMALNEKKKRKREVLCDTYDEHVDTELEDSPEDFLLDEYREMEREELHKLIFSEMLKKNERWYQAIRLVYYLDIPHAKVAEEMGITIPVLYSLLHRAKRWIKKRFGVEYEELGKV